MRGVFRDENLELAFREQGYVVVDLLDNFLVDELNSFYLNNNPNEQEASFFSTHYTLDREFKKKEALKIRKVFGEKVNNYIIDHSICFGSGMIKKAKDEKSVVPLHADWSFVDENEYSSVALWCPLTNTTLENGAIGIIPTSHKILYSIRGPKIPSCFNHISSVVIDHYGKFLELKAGEALIYDHRLWHYSGANESNIDRLAVHVDLVPNEAQILHYCILNDEELVAKYEVESHDFFLEYDYYKRPDLGGTPEHIENKNVSVDINAIHSHFGVESDTKKNKGFLKRIVTKFFTQRNGPI